MSLPSPTVPGEWPTYQRCLWKHGDLQCIRWQSRSLYCSVLVHQKHPRLLVCPSSKEVKHGLSLLQHEIVGIMEERRRRMWSADPPARTSKQRGSGGSIRQTRPDKLSPGLRSSHCLLCRHTTYPQSLPFKFASKRRWTKGRGWRDDSGHGSKPTNYIRNIWMLLGKKCLSSMMIIFAVWNICNKRILNFKCNFFLFYVIFSLKLSLTEFKKNVLEIWQISLRLVILTF